MHNKKAYSKIKPGQKSKPFFPPTIQRSPIDPDGGEHDFKLRTPSLSGGFGRESSSLSFNLPPLSLDPEFQAQMRMFRLLYQSLSIPNLESGASLLNSTTFSIGSNQTSSPLSFSQQFLNLPMLASPPMKFNLPKAKSPLVPAGQVPERPRAGTPRDVLKAIMKIPVVESGLDKLKENAKTTIKANWQSLSTGDKTFVLTQGVILGTGLTVGILSDSDARNFAAEQISGKKIPIPKTPLSIQLNLVGENQGAMLFLDVGALFRKKKKTESK